MKFNDIPKDFYCSPDNINWGNRISIYKIFIKIFTCKVLENIYIWHPELCPNGTLLPSECEHLENSKRIYQLDFLPKWINFHSSNVTRKEMLKLLSLNDNNINAHFYKSECKWNLENLLHSYSWILFIFKALNLNKFEKNIIRSYADFVAPPLNNTLRSINNQDIAHIYYEYLLNKSLSKVGEDNNKIVYGMSDRFQDKQYPWFKNRIGEIIQIPNFLSTSLDKWKARNFYFEIERIPNGRGKYIEPYTNKQNEKEVVFLSNSKFKVIDVNQSNKTIKIKEVDYKTPTKYILYDLFDWNYFDKPGEKERY